MQTRDEWFIVRIGGDRYVGRHRTDDEAMEQVRDLLIAGRVPLDQGTAMIVDPHGVQTEITVIHSVTTHTEELVWTNRET